MVVGARPRVQTLSISSLGKNNIRKGEESNLPRPGTPTAYGFEGRGGHQTPSSSKSDYTRYSTNSQVLMPISEVLMPRTPYIQSDIRHNRNATALA